MEDKHKRRNRNRRYMINRAAIQQWSEHAPWIDNAQIEQDLIICRALVSIFSDEFLASQLAFRGGTALHKLYLSPQPRYSEDIDLVQITPGPIKPIMYRFPISSSSITCRRRWRMPSLPTICNLSCAQA